LNKPKFGAGPGRRADLRKANQGFLRAGVISREEFEEDEKLLATCSWDEFVGTRRDKIFARTRKAYHCWLDLMVKAGTLTDEDLAEDREQYGSYTDEEFFAEIYAGLAVNLRAQPAERVEVAA
jgi:hypothetical protein